MYIATQGREKFLQTSLLLRVQMLEEFNLVINMVYERNTTVWTKIRVQSSKIKKHCEPNASIFRNNAQEPDLFYVVITEDPHLPVHASPGPETRICSH